LPRARGFDWDNLTLRAVSAVVLAAAAAWAVWVFDQPAPAIWGAPFIWRAPFLVMVSVGAALLSLEWAAMATPRAAGRTAVVTALAVLAVVFLTYEGQLGAAWAAIGVGALAAAAVARGAAARAIDAAYGVLYIAPACLVIVWLRETPQGRGWILMLFATTWAADIAAFLVGSALKGPKLWPRYSPNKTWSGFCGGLVGATAAAVAVAAGAMRRYLAGAAVIGLVGGLATMAGDLWESMLKRRYGVKDSGDIIPGHGGLLDRVDGLMFAVMAFAVARLIVHYGWAH
jgi:phosphatidate cytidylyltransferase